jgi:hypothetical protein
MSSLAYTTTEEQLALLKDYLKSQFQGKGFARSVKSGLVDIRDLLPAVMVIPILEIVKNIYNDGLFDIERTYRISVVDKAYKIEDVRDSVKDKLFELKKLFSGNTLDWALPNSSGELTAFTYETDTEILSEPTALDNQYTQYATLPVRIRSYIQAKDPVIPNSLVEVSYLELLDHLHNSMTGLTIFQERWRDFEKPISLSRFPVVGVFLGQSNEDKDRQTSTEYKDLTPILRVYSSLATKEIAFINHLRNVETIKIWILNNSTLDGRAESFQLTSIDYGIDEFTRPFQGGQIEEFPVFRSDITTICSLLQYT